MLKVGRDVHYLTVRLWLFARASRAVAGDAVGHHALLAVSLSIAWCG